MRLGRYCLVAAGVVAALVGVVVVVVANLPGGGVDEYQRTGRRDDPYSWPGWLAAGMAVAFLAWSWLMWRFRPSGWATDARQRWIARVAPDTAETAERRRRVKRLAASVAMAVGAAVGLALVTIRMPARDRGGGPDLSFPLMQFGTAAVLVGVLLVAGAWLVRRPADAHLPRRRTRLVAIAASAGASAALLVAVAVLVVPLWVVAANTTATTATSGAPANRAPVLDGTIAWSVTRAGEASAGGGAGAGLEAFEFGAASVAETLSYNPYRVSLIGTAGGLAVRESRGVRMLDPATGARRWSLHRWDARHFGPRHTRNSAHTGTAAASPEGRWLAMTMFVDAPRSLLIDDARARTRVWVLDTISGERLVDAPVPDSARVVAVDRDRVAFTTAIDDENSDEGRVLAVLGRDGAVAWRHSPDEGCRPLQVRPVEKDLLALVSCPDGRTRLWRADGETGVLDWTWQAEASLGEAGSLAVAGPTAVVQLLDSAEREASTRLLTGVRVSDGAVAWRRPADAFGTPPAAADPTGTGPLRAVAGTVVFAEKRDDAVVVRAFDAAAGRPTWTGEIPHRAGIEIGTLTGPDALLADGRFLLAYPDPADDNRCVLGVWDGTTGEQRQRAALSVGGNQPSCRGNTMHLMQAPGVVVAWQPNRGYTDRPWLAVLG